ncbi:helicase [Aeromicrobium sp. A1-2]|nr:helicase [Aeromicrobium sp. A1-2]
MSMRVQRAIPFPSSQEWSEAHCRVARTGDHFEIVADAWLPGIAPDESRTEATDQLDDVYRLGQSSSRRRLESVPADPFWSDLLGFSAYQSSAQKQAARAVASSSPGDSLLVVLPTGHGKTAIAWIRMLQSPASVTVVVVPTVILALDMERRTKGFFRGRRDGSPSGRYAYTGALDSAVKESIRRDIREGTQRIVFASPEAVVTGLSASLIAAAEDGVLGTLVIDEAHLVEDWGSEFRPEFQSLAGLRQVLLQRAGANAPVTLMLSATIGERHLLTLETLFAGSDGALGVIWGSALRTEPAFFANSCLDDSERDGRVLEAVMCAPRPLIVYTTKVRDAAAMASMLRERGLSRVALVTGESTESDRRAAIEGWRGQASDGRLIDTSYDVVVGTSAFGLGLDFSEVRTVIHACVPETLDRFYQEVGRSGRDGLPSMGIAYWTDQDFRTARSMSRTTLISPKKGWKRWDVMRSNATQKSARVLSLDLNSLPPYLSEGFMQSAQWNLRTLNLMARAKLIRLSQAGPPDAVPGQSRTEREEALQTFYKDAWSRLDVTLLDGLAGDEGHWRERVAAATDVLRRLEEEGFAKLIRMTNASECIGSTLAAHYSPRRGLLTERACRGCSWCRSNHQLITDGFYARPPDPDPNINGLLGSGMLPLLSRPETSMGVWWKDVADRRINLPTLLASILRRCIPAFIGALDAEEVRKIQRLAPGRPMIFNESGESLWTQEGPLVYVHSAEGAPLPDGLVDRFQDGLPTVYCFGENLRGIDNPDFNHVDLVSNQMSLRTALGRL